MGFLNAALELFQAVNALMPGDSTFGKPATEEEIARAKAAVAPWLTVIEQLQALGKQLEELQPLDLDRDAKLSAVTQAEQRLAGIGTSVKAKEERMAILLQEEDRISAELATRRGELAAVEGRLAEYRAKIAAL